MNVLKIYTLNEDGTSKPFPNEYEQAEFDDYEYTASRMGGAPSITAKIKHSLCLDNLWTEKQYVEFRDCKYFVRDTPSSSKDNTDTRYNHDITFLHERFVLENVYMIDSVFTDEDNPEAQPETDKYVSNSTKVIFWGDINEFVGRFNACLYAAGLGGSEKSGGFYVVVDEGVTSEELLVSFEDKFFSEALQEIFNTFKLPYYWVGRCCHIGLAPNELAEVFEYGAENSLLSIEKQNTNQGYCNRATGVGSSDNIPYYYPNVEAPDVTIPHAVEGNKGITDDTQLSLVADEKARERWNDMESVTDEETPWENRGLVCIGGDVESSNIIFTEGFFSLPSSPYRDYKVKYRKGLTESTVSDGFFAVNEPWGLNFGYEGEPEIYDFYTQDYKKWEHFGYGKYIRPLGYEWYEQNYWDVLFRQDPQDPYHWLRPRDYMQNTLCNVALPFRVSSDYGCAKIETIVRLLNAVAGERYQRGGGLDYIPSELQSLSFLEASVKTYNEENDHVETVTDGVYINMLAEECGMVKTGYKLVFEFFHFAQKKDTLYFISFRLKNETGSLGNPSVYYPCFYYISVSEPKISPCGLRWYKEPLTSVSQLSYHRDLEYYGVSSTQSPMRGDRVVRLFKKSMSDEVSPVCSVLMPTIYRDTHGKKSFYNALNENKLIVDKEYKDYKDFYKNKDNAYIEFEHEFVTDNQRETKYTFENIKPTIKNMVSVTKVDDKNVPMNMFLDVAYDTSDNDFLNVDNEANEAKYAHSYFFVKLPKTTTNTGGTERNFNLFACADENGNDMLFSVTSGSCGGCNFKVMVDEETKSKNPVLVDDAGNLLRDKNGNVLLVGNKNASGYTYQNRQQHTDINEVWVALEKETDTYGIIMPNSASRLKVVKGDTFVILNIHLPLAYILDAEDRLSKAIIEQMQKDNSERFSFNISLSRIYLEENRLIARSLTENSKIFVRYNGLTIPLYVNNYSLKMSSGSALPEISIDLNDEISIGKTYSQKKQGNVSEPISAIMGGTVSPLPIITSTDKATNPSDANIYSALATITKFLRKNEEDWATALQHFTKGIEVTGGINADMCLIGEQIQGLVGMLKGVSIRSNGDIYAKNLYLEEGLVVPSVKFNRITGILGYFVISVAGGKIKGVAKDELLDSDGNVLYQQTNKDGSLLFDENGNPITTKEDTGHKLYANSGWLTLDLESGEAGSVAVGDMLIGFWHDLYDNSRVNSDGKKINGELVRNGDITLKGFQTIYFYVDKIDEESVNTGRFHYVLRCEQDETWTYTYHPQPEMDFFGFGNQKDEERQSIMIMSREYSVRLINKNWWTYDHNNVIEIHGKLDGFSMIARNREGVEYVKRFSGYGNVSGNSYIFGQIDQFERVAYKMEVDTGGDNFIASNETKTLRFTVIDGYGTEVTPKQWKITRNSGRTNDDNVWNIKHEGIFNGTIDLRLSEDFVGIDRATFVVIATMSDEQEAKMIVEI